MTKKEHSKRDEAVSGNEEHVPKELNKKNCKGHQKWKGHKKHWKPHQTVNTQREETGYPWGRPIIIVIPPRAVNLAGRLFAGARRRCNNGFGKKHRGKWRNRGKASCQSPREEGSPEVEEKAEGTEEKDEGILVDLDEAEDNANEAGETRNSSDDFEGLPPWLRGILPALNDDDGEQDGNRENTSAPEVNEEDNIPPWLRTGRVFGHGRDARIPPWLKGMIREGLRMYAQDRQGRGRRGNRGNAAAEQYEAEIPEEYNDDQEISQEELLAMYEQEKDKNDKGEDKEK